MIINPKKAVENGWINNVDSRNIQQNGIDLRIRDIEVNSQTPIYPGDIIIPSLKKRIQTQPLTLTESEVWKSLNTPYDCGWIINPAQYTERVLFIESFEYVEIPKDVGAVIITRSTMNRCGAIAISAFYDSGFCGPVRYTLYPHVMTPIALGKGDPSPAQIIFMDAESASLYNGVYKDKKDNSAKIT